MKENGLFNKAKESLVDQVANESEKKEMVDHPIHYNKEGRKECIDEMVDIFGWEDVCTWAIITAYKYRYRCGEKDAVEQEKAKIKWYETWALQNVSSWMHKAKDSILKYFRAVNLE